MGNIGDPISETIPAVGTSGTTYATNINLFLTEVKNRLEAKLPKSQLASGALDMNGSAVQNTSYVGVSNAGGAPSSPSNTIQAYGGNMYWINTGGAVQITSGTTLNTSLVGGITGDYGGANPAQFRFVDADQEYYAYDDFAGGAWARVWAKNFDIAAGATSSNRVRLTYGGAGSYTLTLPPAAPGSTSGLKMDSGGAVTTYTGTTKTMIIPVVPGMERISGSPLVKDWDYTYNSSSFSYMVSTNVSGSHFSLFVPIVIPNGCTITNVSVRIDKTTSSSTTIKTEFWKVIDGATTSIASATDAGNATGLNLISMGSLSEVPSTNKSYTCEIRRSVGTGTGDKVHYVSVTYNEPSTFY